ncbi:hypothetical protein [Rhodococcus sp. BP22]|uniref:hypothetical protein n=1 Tax=Rhodococcus sp. BP22 TaxID=2758566 RepID=UPI0016450E18|nr:hypothetical protein [Rhodococcus sp. BP22]
MAEEFSVKYDGEALANHVMEVRTLAPALLALGDALKYASEALTPEKQGGTSAPTLRIKATNEGSFDIDLIIDAVNSDQSVGLLGMASFAGIIWGSVKGAIQTIKWLRGRSGVRLRELEPGFITYEDENGSTLTVPAGSSVLIQNGPFRVAIDGFTQPLDQEGIDEVSISGTTDRDRITVDTNDRPAFRTDSRDRLIDRSVRQATVKVETVQLNTDSGRKWRFSEDGETFTADISDQRFVMGVRSGRTAVGADDTLGVELEEETYRRPAGGVRVLRRILAVTSHQHAPVQGELDYGFGTQEFER